MRDLGSLGTHAAWLGKPAKVGSVIPFSMPASDIFLKLTAGLTRRLRIIKSKDVVIGLSGGLDSSLAVLVAHATFVKLGYKTKGIHVYSMPCFGTSKRTSNNAARLCEGLGLTLETIPIEKPVKEHLALIGHDGKTQDTTYENAQARMRTMILMNKANMYKGIVLGTADMSELALGWCTYNGDHMSMFSINSGIPKTIVRKVCKWWIERNEKSKTKLGIAAKALIDVVDTPISPELLKDQRTEDVIGPYEYHDFFLWNFIVNEMGPKALFKAATEYFRPRHRRDDVAQVLKNPAELAREKSEFEQKVAKTERIFFERFFSQAFKRNCQPDGIKVYPFELSPRDWWMPSDIGPVKLFG